MAKRTRSNRGVRSDKPKSQPGKPKSKISGKKRAVAKSKPAPAAGGGALLGKAYAIEYLRWVHGTTDLLVKDMTHEQTMFQSTSTDNHAMWTIGHLATAFSWMASMIDGTPATLPENYNGLFGYQSKPSSDPRLYPPMSEVREFCEIAFNRMMDALSSLTEEQLLLPPASESHGFAKSRLDAAMKCAWHEGWHQGQIASLRRAMGMKPLF